MGKHSLGLGKSSMSAHKYQPGDPDIIENAKKYHGKEKTGKICQKKVEQI